MISLKSLSAEWIAEKRNQYAKDPALMESMIHALYLLEQLKMTGLDFVFKGGTSLILLLANPKRFSVDIDIIVNTTTSREVLEGYLQQIAGKTAFIRMEPDEKRSYKSGIPKAHYKFIYKSGFPNRNKEGAVISNPEREILLDVLFADIHYPVLIERPLHTEWIIQEGEPVIISMPDVSSITGDKLTAFAPNTTGILYKSDKEKEILKQLFDVGCLFDLLTDIATFRTSFIASAKGEIAYRPERNIPSVEHVLQDIIDTALMIAQKDILKTPEDRERFEEIKTGINQFRHYVFSGKFEILEAQVASAKAAYLAALILTNYNDEIRKFDEAQPLNEYLINHPDYNFLNKRLKFIAKGEALFYWFHAINLLYPLSHENGG